MQKSMFSSFNIVGENMSSYLEKHKKLLEIDTTILITGETGTGKELMARWIHFSDKKRSDKPFVKITIPNIGENIFESEVFGYEKGAFTGATTEKKGLVEVAEDGTVFIDEIENTTLSIQSKLLQLLEEKVYRKVGGTQYLCTEARFIIATNLDLFKEVLMGQFRSDLYYRLAVLEINLPRLIERNRDILDISNYFIDKYNIKFGKKVKHFDEKATKQLLSHSWNGNIRELKNFIERSMIYCEGDTIDLSELKTEKTKSKVDDQYSYKDFMKIMEYEYFENMFAKTEGNVDDIARIINMSVPFVYKKLKEHGIK